MRHQQLKDHDSYAKVDVAAVWPASAQVAPLPLPEIAEAPAAAEFTPTPAAPELAGGVGGMIVAAYVALLTAFIFATVGSAESIFMVVIAAFFMFMFFMVPAAFFGIEGGGKRPSFERFWAQGMETLTGHASAKPALVQMLIVPVFLTSGVIAMGMAAAIII
jgi:hypothetical protein